MRKGKPNESKGLLKGVAGRLYFYFALILSLILVISILKALVKIKQVQDEIANKELEVEKVAKEQGDLQNKLDYTKSQEFVEKQLRDKLGLAKQGEIVVILPPPEVLRKFAPHYTEEQEVLPDPNWKRWLKLFI